jgi:hypothetical protein
VPTLADFEGMQPGPRVADHMSKVTGFIAREPADGAKPTQRTDVYLAYDQRNLYAVFVCWDNEPSKIRARMTRREDIFSDDSAEIMIDTFHDSRHAYAFAVNPLWAFNGTHYGRKARSRVACLPITTALILPSIRFGIRRGT